ncbi:MAG: helix-turn-helix domain-containing protein [Clostridia bacterium]|nr:helix-turn-helix domain-containing protein [Clostridia bacterium]
MHRTRFEDVREKILTLMAEDEYSQKEIARMVGVHDTTICDWKVKFPDFAEECREATAKLVEKRLVECKRSLQKLINGYYVDEERTDYIPDEKDPSKAKIRSQSTYHKYVAPNLGAIIHYQSNMDPEHWQNKQRLEHTGKDGEELPLRPLTAEEIEFLRESAEK